MQPCRKGREAGRGGAGGKPWWSVSQPGAPPPSRRRYSTASITAGEGKRINESLLNPNWTEEETHWWLEFNVQISCDQIIESQRRAAAAALPPLRRGAVSPGHACAAFLPKNVTNSKNSFASRKQGDGLQDLLDRRGGVCSMTSVAIIRADLLLRQGRITILQRRSKHYIPLAHKAPSLHPAATVRNKRK